MCVKSRQDVFDVVRSLWVGHALLAAHELGILNLLWRTDLSTDEIADEFSLDLRGTRALVSTLRDLGLIEQGGDVNSLTPVGREAADPEGALSGYLAFHASLRPSWTELPDRLRRRATGKFHPNCCDSPKLVESYLKAMEALGQPVADDLAKALNVKPGERVLDLGGGSGVHARAILARQPQAHVTLVERPVVVQVLRKWLQPCSSDNLRIVEGDYLSFDGKGKFDVVLLANVIHNEEPTNIVRIFDNCRAALRSGGRVAILDYLTPPPPKPGTSPPGFTMLIYLITRRGEVYSREALINMASNAGFDTPRIIRLEAYHLAIFKTPGG